MPQTKVKVIVRVRPSLKPDSKTCATTDGNKIHIVNFRNKSESLQYDFCSVFNESSSQQKVFSEVVDPLLKNAFDGQNVSVFAYGPTGAGKTHTMLGVMSDPGIIPRTVQSIFKMIQDEVESASLNQQKPQHTVTFSYLEIYNEKVQDLLKAGNSDLPIREDASHNIFVAGLTEKPIQTFEDFKNCFGPASSNRTVAATKLNEASSRSHSILLLKVTRRANGKVYRGKVYLIDLAGSEDNRRTGNQGIRMKESAAINKSLFVLGEVVDAINQNQIRIPYRNSKLTRLLQDSIGGSCHSVMITNIAPEQHYYYDTYCTLNFATKSKKIVNVNTASIKQNSPSTEKPTAQLQPTKRRSDSVSEPSKAKRSRRSSIAGIPQTGIPQRVRVEVQPQCSVDVLPSPMLRRQAQFESQVNEKLQELEKLMQGMKNRDDLDAVTQLKEQVVQAVSGQNPTKLSSSCSTPSLGTARRRSERVACEKRKSLTIPETPLTPEEPETSKQKDSSPEKSKGLKDTTNVLYQHYLKGMGKRSKERKKKLIDDDLISHSPLFRQKKPEPDFVSPEKKAKAAVCKFQNDDQMQRNTDFLNLLNTASVKDLQKLQKVGAKRAQMIYDYRQINGPFDFVDDLSDIPGFTANFIKSLLKTNLLTQDVL